MNRIIFPILIMGFVVLFQNCGKSGVSMTDMNLEESNQFFSYPYDSKPIVYSEILLARDAYTEGSSTQKYTIIASITAADGSLNSIDYDLNILDKDGSIVCPRKQGTLTSGSSTIEYECSGTAKISPIIIEATGTINGESFTLSKSIE